jgi:antitoxin (DNA-binding transcriptional repressor) of toxin-antitoxin stability system
MIAVGVRELKNRLSEYLRLVRAGEHVLVTDRGEVVAELRAPDRGHGASSHPPGLVELARRGKARLGDPKQPDAYPALPPLLPPGRAQRLLDEERGDR